MGGFYCIRFAMLAEWFCLGFVFTLIARFCGFVGFTVFEFGYCVFVNLLFEVLLV